MKRIQSIVAVALVAIMTVDTVQAIPFASPATVAGISIPASLGSVTETHGISSPDQKPDVILIQDLHVNRSVQFAISGILDQLKGEGLLPERIAVEGATGPLDISKTQHLDARLRKSAADYLVRQGEIPGPMHFAIVKGEGSLYGVENAETYAANLEIFRRSYASRMNLLKELDVLSEAVPVLESDKSQKDKAARFGSEVAAVRQMISNDVVPEELPETMRQASLGLSDLKKVLAKEGNTELVSPLADSINFYTLALMRNDDISTNLFALRNMDHQKTSVLVAGGFHTPGLTQVLRTKGLSYAVITPVVRRHTKVDEKLYVERLLGHHLTKDQIATGVNWAELMLAPKGADAVQMAGEISPEIAKPLGRISLSRISITARVKLTKLGTATAKIVRAVPGVLKDAVAVAATSRAVRISASAGGVVGALLVAKGLAGATVGGVAAAPVATAGVGLVAGLAITGALVAGGIAAFRRFVGKPPVQAVTKAVDSVRSALPDVAASAAEVGENVKELATAAMEHVPGLGKDKEKERVNRLGQLQALTAA